MDATHVPVGCSVWPALFTQGTNWPEHGEIGEPSFLLSSEKPSADDRLESYKDIFEVVNNENANQYALHTTAGCTASVNQTLGQSGNTGATSCNQAENSGSGCTVRDSNKASAGDAFNAAGGGVYVAAFEVRLFLVWCREEKLMNGL